MLYKNYYGCRRLFQSTIENYKVTHLKSTGLNRIQAGPSLGFRSRGTRNHKGATFLKQILDVCSNRGPSMKWGTHILNGGRAPLALPLATTLHPSNYAHLLQHTS